MEQGAKRRSEKSSDGWPKRLLAKFPYHCHMHLNLIYDTKRWYHKWVHEIGWYLNAGGPNLGPLWMVQSVVINFSSKVYSKSLLKGSVVYSLILDYQFCTCIMWISSIPQLQVIHMECLYDYR